MLLAASRLTDRAYAAGDSPAGATPLDDSPCPPGHNTPLPLERSPPVSFKRLLGSSIAYEGLSPGGSARSPAAGRARPPWFLCATTARSRNEYVTKFPDCRIRRRNSGRPAFEPFSEGGRKSHDNHASRDGRDDRHDRDS